MIPDKNGKSGLLLVCMHTNISRMNCSKTSITFFVISIPQWPDMLKHLNIMSWTMTWWMQPGQEGWPRHLSLCAYCIISDILWCAQHTKPGTDQVLYTITLAISFLLLQKHVDQICIRNWHHKGRHKNYNKITYVYSLHSWRWTTRTHQTTRTSSL